jgi:3-hydroxyisobutyrate dehydrogenase-like beta-hydroxyacid dehydrogenase
MQTVGFVGLGNMGRRMSSRLLERGYRVVGYDLRPDALPPLVVKGLTEAKSPREVAEAAETVMTSLPSPRAVREVALGREGLIHAGRPGTLMIEMSTCGPAVIEEIDAAFRARGLRLLDSPVSGGVRGADEGALTVMVAGDAAAFEASRPLLEVIGRNIVYLGAKPGLGQALKLINNLLSATAIVATSEALVMGVKAGLDPDKVLEVVNASTGRSGASLDKFPRHVLTRSFDFGSPIEIMYKDVSLAVEMAEHLGVPAFVGAIVKQMWGYAMSRGRAKDDLSTIIRSVEEWVGVEVRGKAAPPRAGQPD